MMQLLGIYHHFVRMLQSELCGLFGYFIPGVRTAATGAHAGCLYFDTAETAYAGG
jgi:hypothetical protein